MNDHVPFAGYTGVFREADRARFARIDRPFMEDMTVLKECLAEFDTYRHVWAEMIANDVPPGRDSVLKDQMEAMQGYALMMLDGAMHRLRLRIRGEQEDKS